MQNKFVKWEQELNQPLCSDIFVYGQIHRDVYRLTNITKLRSFQYRLLQRALVTNIDLSKWGVIDHDTCFFCETSKETILHLLWKCEVSQGFWAKVVDYCQQRFEGGDSIRLTEANVIHNKICCISKNHVINFVCLFAKQFIYRQKCLKQQFHFPIFEQLLKCTANVEKYIASKNNRLDVHQRKWFPTIKDGNSIEQFVEQYIRELN